MYALHIYHLTECLKQPHEILSLATHEEVSSIKSHTASDSSNTQQESKRKGQLLILMLFNITGVI